jgi:hypothetical protein
MNIRAISVTAVDVEGFWRDGYIHMPGVFAPAEVDAIRESVRAAAAEDHRGDLLSHPRLRDLVLDERIIEAAKELLGGPPIYFADSNFRIQRGGLRNPFHKDNADRSDPDAPDWHGRYTVLRFGLYLQDHSRSSGGLTVRVGSHRSRVEGRMHYVRTHPGDLVAWTLPMTHQGHGLLLKGLPGVQLEPRISKYLPRALFVPPPPERIALFITMGLDGPHLRRYLTYLKGREYMIEKWRASVFSPDLIAEAARHGLRVLDLRPLIRDGVGMGTNVKWAGIARDADYSWLDPILGPEATEVHD